jgi:hypothetical protein
MTKTADNRPSNIETQNEDLKPSGEGRPPRQASEPRGSEGSARTPRTRTDPASGEQGGKANPDGPRSLRDTPKVG